MRTRYAERGFSLVELLVAAMLLATGLVAGAAAFSAATRAQGAALRTATATRLAQAKLAEVEALAPESGSEEGSFADVERRTPEQAFADYDYRWEAEPAEAEGLVRAEVSVWHRERPQAAVTLVLYFPAQEEAAQ